MTAYRWWEWDDFETWPGGDAEWDDPCVVRNHATAWEDHANSELRPRGGISGQLRYRVLLKSKHQCAHCGIAEGLQVDHIVPVARGGTNEIENLQMLCGLCNRRKGAMSERQALTRLAYA